VRFDLTSKKIPLTASQNLIAELFGQQPVYRLLVAVIEPQKRAHSPQLAAGLASESENGKVPYGRRFPAACCGELQILLVCRFYFTI
jgi:hypothetical protein